MNIRSLSMKTALTLLSTFLVISSCSSPEDSLLVPVTLKGADLTLTACSGGLVLENMDDKVVMQAYLFKGKELTFSQMDSLPKSAWISFEPDTKHCAWASQAINILHIEPR
jgi:hypothetical protein